MNDENKNSLSHLSSYSVIVFALALFLAVALDIVFPIRMFKNGFHQYFGVAIVGLGTYIVYWAEFHGQKFSHKRKRGEISSSDHLKTGPYARSRNPKYVGLGVLLIGLGIILNSVFVASSAFISILFIHFFLLHKEENLMIKRHGDIYHEYKKKVRRWL